VWYTYASYLTRPVADLAAAARALVASGLAEAAVTSDGDAAWRTAAEVREGHVTIDRDETSHAADVRLPSRASEFAEEAFYQAARLRFGELQLFGGDGPYPVPYVRAFVGPCRFFFEDAARAPRDVYPILKVYQTGEVSVSLRVIGDGNPVDVDAFVREFVVAYAAPYAGVAVPPGVSLLGPLGGRDDAEFRWIWRRWRLAAAERLHEQAVREATTGATSGDFPAVFAPLALHPGTPESIRTLALTLFNMVAYSLSRPRAGWPMVLLGQRAMGRRGGSWTGRAHVYLIRHEDQAETAAENEARHGQAFGKILAGVIEPGIDYAKHFVPRSARQWGDFAAYVGGPTTLWVYSRSGVRRLEASPWADGNRGHFVYDPHVQTELIDYGYVLHRRLADEAAAGGPSTEAVLRTQARLAEFDGAVAGPWRYGEVADLLRGAWEAMGVARMRKATREMLAIRESQASAIESRRSARWSVVLTAVFGLLAFPAIAADVLAPLWRVRGWPLPRNGDAAATLLNVIAFTLVLAAVVGAYVGHRWVDRAGREP
jgi:hypothetical protein